MIRVVANHISQALYGKKVFLFPAVTCLWNVINLFMSELLNKIYRFTVDSLIGAFHFRILNFA